MEGIALPAVSSSSHAVRLHVTIFSTLDSQTARLWASGSTQQRGDYHINPRKHGVSQVFVHLDTVFHFAPYSTQQVMTLILTSFFQFLCYFLGQERIICCELHWTIEHCGWRKAASWQAGLGPKLCLWSLREQESGSQRDNVGTLCLSVGIFHCPSSTPAEVGVTTALPKERGPTLLPPCSHAAWLHPLHEKRPVPPVDSSGAVVRSGTPYSSLRKT